MPNTSIPVVIFCGGKGTRLKEETEFKPKPMVTVGGQPILWHIMKYYAHHGYNRFVLALGYKGNMIKEYFLNHKMFCSDFRMKNGEVAECYTNHGDNTFDITFADTGEDTPTAERLLLLNKYIPDKQFMVTYGDGLSNVDIPALVAFHNAQGVMGTITGVHPTSKYGLVRVDAQNRITEFQQKPLLHDYVNGGFMVFQQDFFSALKPGQMIEDTFLDIVGKKQLALYQHDGYWHCMDTYQDYQELNRQWADGPQWKVWE